MLGKNALIKALGNKEITCEPIYSSQISIGSIDVRLSDIIIYPKPFTPALEDAVYDFELNIDGSFTVISGAVQYKQYCLQKTQGDSFVLHPGKFILASTIETIGQKSHNYQSVICGKSSLARCGLQIESAGLIEAGNELSVTLEIKNLGSIPINLYYGMQIAQVTWHQLEGGSPENLYSGKYLRSLKPMPPQ